MATSTTSSHHQLPYMSGSLRNGSTASVTRDGRNKVGRDNNNQENPASFGLPTPRSIQPQHQNWLARFLRIKPAVSVLCFQVSKVRARKEIAATFREWRKYGIRDIVVDKAAGRIWARVAEKNCEFFFGHQKIPVHSNHIAFHSILFNSSLSFPTSKPQKNTNTPLPSALALHIKPVSLAVELFTVLHHGRKSNLSLARFTQERGAKSSFGRVVEALESVLTARGFLVEEGGRKGEMLRAL